jgi:two-component system response regulator QseB
MRILLVEDDAMIGQSLVRALGDEGYVVDWVQDGAAALEALASSVADYVLALLDWNLPRRSGLEVLQQLRAGGRALPVLMLTARDDTQDVVAGLDAGADDYLVKPFELSELKARIRSLARRGQGRASNVTRHGELEVDASKHSVLRAGEPVALTAREFALLCVLLEQPQTVRSRRQLEEHLYGWAHPVESNAVEVLIHALRRKLGPLSIENIRGVGWRLRETA